LEGTLEFNHTETSKAYQEIFELDEVLGIVDGVIAQFLVFKCLDCATVHRMTYKELELQARKEISERVMTLKASGELDKAITIKNRFYIYCGNCTGFDGAGACPKVVYENCKLRRIPNVL
jgi:hypothetical protein